jgi:hypothetical protein
LNDFIPNGEISPIGLSTWQSVIAATLQVECHKVEAHLCVVEQLLANLGPMF